MGSPRTRAERTPGKSSIAGRPCSTRLPTTYRPGFCFGPAAFSTTESDPTGMPSFAANASAAFGRLSFLERRGFGGADDLLVEVELARGDAVNDDRQSARRAERARFSVCEAHFRELVGDDAWEDGESCVDERRRQLFDPDFEQEGFRGRLGHDGERKD